MNKMLHIHGWTGRQKIKTVCVKSFREHCEFMFGGPLQAKSEEEKFNYLMLWAGEKGRSINTTWNLTEDQ